MWKRMQMRLLMNPISEYRQKRVTHLDAVSAVNQLRAKKTHDETMGLHVFGVTVSFSNLVRDGLLILIALLSLKADADVQDSEG